MQPQTKTDTKHFFRCTKASIDTKSLYSPKIKIHFDDYQYKMLNINNTKKLLPQQTFLVTVKTP